MKCRQVWTYSYPTHKATTHQFHLSHLSCFLPAGHRSRHSPKSWLDHRVRPASLRRGTQPLPLQGTKNPVQYPHTTPFYPCVSSNDVGKYSDTSFSGPPVYFHSLACRSMPLCMISRRHKLMLLGQTAAVQDNAEARSYLGWRLNPTANRTMNCIVTLVT